MNFPNYGIEIYHENGLKYAGRFGDRYGQIFDKNGLFIMNVRSGFVDAKRRQFPKITPFVPAKAISLQKNQITAKLEGDNEFSIATTDQAVYKITEFHKNGDDTINVKALYLS